MHSIIRTCIDYLQFYIHSDPASGHGIHSPFAFQFAKEVLGDKTAFADYQTWQQWRDALRADKAYLPIVELGAGSATAPDRSARRVADLVSRVSKPVRTGRLLYRIARYYRPDRIVELGTSLGLSTAWFSLARPQAAVFTIEGNLAVAEKAQSNFDRWGRSNITLVKGNFDDCLPSLLEQLSGVDLVFLDGNHRREPTLRYFEQLLSKKHSETIFIVDDIHWSAEMKEAWSAIKQHPEVRCTIDLFQFGLVLFKKEFKEVRHFSIRF
jgi:predicted O-methyltransferase YrrM